MLIVGLISLETVRTKWTSALESWSPYILGLARIVAGLQFLGRGLMKVAHILVADPHSAEPLQPLIFGGSIIELAGGALIAAGFLTRVAALICSGEMAIAYVLFHARQGLWSAINQGDALLLFFFFLYLVFAGPGEFAFETRRVKPPR